MNRFSSVIITLLTALVAGCNPTADAPVLSEEEQRVADSRHLDSTAIQTMAGRGADIVFVTGPDSAATGKRLDSLSAKAWILVDDASGLIISAKNARKRSFPASLTKMMTAMLALERERAADTIEISDDVFLAKDSRVRLGDRYTMHNLISEMMLQSDNDAAYALAKHVGGSIDTFCQLMNSKAVYLGMDSTHFSNPNGLPADSTFSTASDLLVLARYCMRDSLFATMAGTASADIPLADGRHLECQNTNLLLDNYEGCIGVKTGYTRQAGACLASAATRHGHTLFLILLGSRSHSSRFTESATLLDYGFQVMEGGSR